MDPKLIHELRQSGHVPSAPLGTVKVLVALCSMSPTEECLDRLTAIGLNVEQSLQDKLIGTIDAVQLETLRQDPDVREVELSVKLGPHGQ